MRLEMAYSVVDSEGREGSGEESRMARKGKTRIYTASRGARRPEAPVVQRGRRTKLVIGGVVLLLVLGSGVLVRWLQQREVVTQLHSAGSSRYTRGPAGAPVVIKEFSDYT